MPKPKPNESQSAFISRCIPIVIAEGYTQDQAVGRCHGLWESAKDVDILELMAGCVGKELSFYEPEGLTLSMVLNANWGPMADTFLDSMFKRAIDINTGRFMGGVAEMVLSEFKEEMTDGFVNKTIDAVVEYTEGSFYEGLKYISRQLVQKDIFDDLVEITGSTRENVMRTTKRWFKNTQGQYFDRFIVSETARLQTYITEAGENVATLNKIGRTYKKFVKAEAYWNHVSEFNTATANIFAQVQGMAERGVKRYRVEAVLDKRTCGVCEHLNGTEFKVEDANARVSSMLIMEADEAALQFPWPGRSIQEDYPDAKDSPYLIPPYHGMCRCTLIPL